MHNILKRSAVSTPDGMAAQFAYADMQHSANATHKRTLYLRVDLIVIFPGLELVRLDVDLKGLDVTASDLASHV